MQEVVRQDGRRLQYALRLFKNEGVLRSAIRGQVGIVDQLLPINARPVVLNEAMSGKRVRLILNYVRTRRRIRRRLMRFFKATV